MINEPFYDLLKLENYKEKIMEQNELKTLFKKWCAQFDKCKHEPMSDDLLNVFKKLTMLEMENGGIPQN